MGCSPSHPITRSPIIYEPNSFYSVTGTRKKYADFELGNTEFELIQEQYWNRLLFVRRQTALSKRKFLEMTEKDLKALAKQFSDLDEAEILDLKLQFQTFDLNQDGIIDYEELFHKFCLSISRTLIQELRRTTDPFANNEVEQIGFLCKRGTDNIQRVRKLSVAKQFLVGLF
ncbi:hypothetical protein P5673_000192 [Acropora cervicornis]|uniref:EF-hand domain-containing protein n=1 Tax=Acropora cervicornis TaxID=6130 RepID=A0AAD9VHG5_ACRCE|nr:hypothetical protein P5673_000192 [Acropora cervicornis]